MTAVAAVARSLVVPCSVCGAAAAELTVPPAPPDGLIILRSAFALIAMTKRELAPAIDTLLAVLVDPTRADPAQLQAAANGLHVRCARCLEAES